MIVLSVIAVLSCVLIPYLSHAHAQAQLRACEGNIKNMATAIETMAAKHGNYMPPGGNGFMSWHREIMNYLGKMPSCPSCGKHYGMEFSQDFDAYTIYCGSSEVSHAACGLEKGYPQYSSVIGIVEHPRTDSM